MTFEQFRLLVDMVAVEYYTKKNYEQDNKMGIKLYKKVPKPKFWAPKKKFLEEKREHIQQFRKKDGKSKNKKLSLYESLMD